VHPALRKGPLFCKKKHPPFSIYFTKHPHFISCLRAWLLLRASFLEGRFPRPTYNFSPTATKLCALNLFFGQDSELQIYHGKLSCSPTNSGGSVAISVLDLGAEGPGFKSQSRRSLRQTVHTHCASVHQAAKLVADLLRVARITAGLVESNGSLPPGL